MKLSRTIAYAIHATLQLSSGERGVPIPCSQLATEGQMPERFLLQILRSLVTRGLLCSTRGVDGGYYLARPADQISLRDIVEAFDNPLSPAIPVLDALRAGSAEADYVVAQRRVGRRPRRALEADDGRFDAGRLRRRMILAWNSHDSARNRYLTGRTPPGRGGRSQSVFPPGSIAPRHDNRLRRRPLELVKFTQAVGIDADGDDR